MKRKDAPKETMTLLLTRLEAVTLWGHLDRTMGDEEILRWVRDRLSRVFQEHVANNP